DGFFALVFLGVNIAAAEQRPCFPRINLERFLVIPQRAVPISQTRVGTPTNSESAFGEGRSEVHLQRLVAEIKRLVITASRQSDPRISNNIVGGSRRGGLVLWQGRCELGVPARAVEFIAAPG